MQYVRRSSPMALTEMIDSMPSRLQTRGEFRSVTDVVSDIRKNVIMTCVNRAFIPLLLNLLHSIQRLKIRRLPTILVICEDKDAYIEMSKVMGNFSMNMLLSLTNLHESVSHATEYKTDDYKSLVQKRVSYIDMFLTKGVNVFYLDSDIVLLDDPFPYFRGNYDLFIQNEQARPNIVDLCTGFFYIRANPRTIELVRRWEKLLPNDPSGNQRVFNRLVRSMKKRTLKAKERLHIKILPTDKFLSGRTFRSFDLPWNQRDPKPIEIHANFLVGRESKVDMLKENNLWFVE